MKIWNVTSATILLLTMMSCQSMPPKQSESNPAPGAASPQGGQAVTNENTSQPSAAKAQSVVHEIEIPSGTAVDVRLSQALSTARNNTGDTFAASLDEPLMLDGKEVLAKGTKFTGHVTTADSSGRLQGRGVLGVTLDSFESNGQTYKIATSLDTRASADHKKRNIEIIGGGAGVGALIGAIAGQGKGAAIGAAAGAAAGTAGAAATGKKEVEIPVETKLKFTLKDPVKIKG